MIPSVALLTFALVAGSTHALPTSTGPLPTASGSADIIATDPLPTPTGPTCVETRLPADPQASDINAAIVDDDSISKACNIDSQRTITINGGMLSVLYYGLNNQYFFNISHNLNSVSRPIASPNLCPDTFKNIFSTCVMGQNSWGGWVMTDGTNRSITNFIYPDNPISGGGAGSSGVASGASATASQSSGAMNPSTGSIGNGAGPIIPGSGINGVSDGTAIGSRPASATLAIDTPTTTNGGSAGQGLLTTGGALNTGGPFASGNSGGQQPLSQSLPVSGQAPGTKLPGAGTTNISGAGTTNIPGVGTANPATQLPDASSRPAGSQQTGGQPPLISTTRPSGPGTKSLTSTIPLPRGATVIYATISSATYSETFIPTTYSSFATLAGTITSSTLDGHSSIVPLVIGPGGVMWVPLRQPSGAGPELSPPTVLPTTPSAFDQSIATSGQSGSSKVQSNGAATSQAASNPAALPSKTSAPGSARGGGGPTGAALSTITTSYDPEASTVTSIGPEVTGNTAIHTSDDHHGLGVYPFWKGGPHCFIICPPGIDNGGIILWGMDKPGIYPPPVPPPFPNIKWPTITINDDLEPTASEKPDDTSTNSKPSESVGSTAKPTEKSTVHSTAQTTSKSSTTSGSYTRATQQYILEIQTVGTEELKQRNSWLAEQHHLAGGGLPGSTGSGSSVIVTTGANSGSTGGGALTTTGPVPSSTRPPLTVSGTSPPTSKAIKPSSSKPATTAAPTGIPPLTDCSLVMTTLTGTIAPGPQTYCTCGPVMAGISEKTSDSTVYSICAGDPFPTIASSALPPPQTTAPPKPQASDAIIIYREDSCNDVDCSSSGFIYAITPGELVDPCNDKSVFSEVYLSGAGNDDSDYPVNFVNFKAHDIDGLEYHGSNKHVGTLTGDIPGSPVQCIVPAAQATSCGSSHSLDADDYTPIVYCEW